VLNLGGGTEQIDALYQQATAYYAQENYAQARDTFAAVAAQYTQMGETAKALEASQFEDLCNSYLQAQTYMNRGSEAEQAENYTEAAQYYGQARDIYAQIGDSGKQAAAQQKVDEAVEKQGSGLNPMLILGIVGVALVILVAMVISRRRSRPARPVSQPSSRFRLEEPVSQAPSPATRPVATPTREPMPTTGAAPPAELVQFHQKTEDALSRFTKGYIRDNLQQAMRVYLSLEGERKQLPRGKDLELERIIDTNLRELEHRIFGTF
jgi:tetratricopeptide (TPR) repeat protein